MRKKEWVEEQNGEHERRAGEEDVGDVVLVDYLVSMRCWGIQPFQEGENGKGNEDEVHHVPAPNKHDIPPGKETNLLPGTSLDRQQG